MKSEIKRHPVITALFAVLVILLVFSLYIFNSSTGSGGVAFGEKIAILEINGAILSSKEVVKQIKSVKKNDKIKGLIVRINSPGGGVAPSQEIYSEIKKLSSKKAVVASFSSIAASGGYYIGCAADKIVANPGTLTGSIGVIMDFSNMKGLLEKLGLKNYVIKSGKFKDIGSPARNMTKEEKNLLQSVIDSVHNQFVEVVAKGRNKAREDVLKIADGRIFSGEQALALGLIDNLGTLQDSIDILSELAGIKGDPKIVYLEKQKGLLDYLLGTSVKDTINNVSIPQLMYSMETY